MKWKEAFKRALLHPFKTVWGFFDNDNHRIVSKAGEKELQRQVLIDLMKHDEELGLYKTGNLHMMDEQEIKQYEYASELSKYDNKEDRQQMIERVEVLIRYRGATAQQILIHKDLDDENLVKSLKHVYTHYDDLIKQSLGL
jgi:hypothetical protein